jgi:hypothetical protein
VGQSPTTHCEIIEWSQDSTKDYVHVMGGDKRRELTWKLGVCRRGMGYPVSSAARTTSCGKVKGASNGSDVYGVTAHRTLAIPCTIFGTHCARDLPSEARPRGMVPSAAPQTTRPTVQTTREGGGTITQVTASETTGPTIHTTSGSASRTPRFDLMGHSTGASTRCAPWQRTRRQAEPAGRR